MITFKTFLLESFADARRKWSNINGLEVEDIDKAIADFKVLRDAHFLNGDESDITYWMKKDFVDFHDFVVQKTEERKAKHTTKATTKGGAKMIFQNKSVTIYQILTYEASCKYGANTKWCITSKDTRQHWDDYTRRGITFYFVIVDKGELKHYFQVNPHLFAKMAVAVYPEGHMSIYNTKDDLMQQSYFEDYMEDFGVDMDIFAPRIFTIEEQVRNIYNGVTDYPLNIARLGDMAQFFWENDYFGKDAAMTYAWYWHVNNYNSTNVLKKHFVVAFEKLIELDGGDMHVMFYPDNTMYFGEIGGHDDNRWDEFVFLTPDDFKFFIEGRYRKGRVCFIKDIENLITYMKQHYNITLELTLPKDEQ